MHCYSYHPEYYVCFGICFRVYLSRRLSDLALIFILCAIVHDVSSASYVYKAFFIITRSRMATRRAGRTGSRFSSPIRRRFSCISDKPASPNFVFAWYCGALHGVRLHLIYVSAHGHLLDRVNKHSMYTQCCFTARWWGFATDFIRYLMPVVPLVIIIAVGLIGALKRCLSPRGRDMVLHSNNYWRDFK